MFEKKKVLFFRIFGALCLANLTLLLTQTAFVFAYSASITTDGSVILNVSSRGNGASIAADNINVVSDCRNGYNLEISTTESPDLYLNGDGTGSAVFTAVNGTSTLGNSFNKWGYTLETSPSEFTVFSPLSTTASTLKTSAETASPSSDINDDFPIYYGVKVDDTVAPGGYEMGNNGAIVYRLTMDAVCMQYTVAFNANGGTGTMSNQNIPEHEVAKLENNGFTAPSGGSYTDANNNTITGDANKVWGFWGWNTRADGTGDWYKGNEEIQDLANAGSMITLYAQWKQATLSDMTAGTQVGTEKVIDHNLMQDMSPEVCYNSDITTAANAPAATLLDYRGKITTGENPELPESYTVSKLPDGLCWMTKNLNLGRDSGGPNGDGTVTLTPDDTDTTSNFTLPAADTTAYTASSYLAKVRLTNNDGTNANGAYYTWNAATTVTAATTAKPNTSICPKNWDLPTLKIYSNLFAKAAYSSSNLTTSAPSSFLIDGGSTDGTNFYQTNYGHFWTNISYNNYNAYTVKINGTTLTSAYTSGTSAGGNKYFRKNLRCVASQGKVTINYDGNNSDGGSTTSQNNVEINSNTDVRANGFTRTGYGFGGWNTAANGSGVDVAAGSAIATLGLKPGENVTLYAQWIPQFTINYVHNCKQWASSDANCTNEMSSSTLGQKINLDANGDGSGTLKNYDAWTDLANWKIKEWTTNADGTGTAYPINSTYAATGASAGDNVTLYAHWIPTYTLQFDGNGAENTNGMGTTNATTGIKSVKYTNVGEGETIALLMSNFKRTGYGFAGWSTNPNATVSSGDRIYGPQEVITAPAYPASGTIVTMYAVWIPAEKDGNNRPIYLQDWDGCSDLTATNFNTNTGGITPGGVTALTDKRDNMVYTIAKLADGKCWMVENLRLNNQYTMGQNQNDSSVTNESLAQGYGGTPGTFGSFVGLANSETISAASTTANSVYKSSANPPVDTYDSSTGTLEDISTASNPSNRFPRYNGNNTQSFVDSPTYTRNYGNAASAVNSGTYPSANLYSKGNYYSWNAALANTNHYTNANSTDPAGKTSEKVGTSICPSGWHLPSSGSVTKEFGILSQSYGGTGDTQSGVANAGDIMSRRFRTFPNNFVFSMNNGTEGRYWGRSSANSSNGELLFMSATSVNPTQHNGKWNGYGVRCVKDEGIGVIETMQEVGQMSASDLAALKSSMIEGEQYQLKDSRDQKLYTVSKLADGRIWMTQDLDLDIDSSVTYTNADTDIGYNTSTGTYSTTSWTPSSSTRTTGTTTWNGLNTVPESYDPGDVYWNGTASNMNDWNSYYGTCSGWADCNESLNPLANYISSSGINQYHLGNYYNWTAAIATNNSSSMTSGNVQRSICPAGWTLPTADSGAGSFEYLYTQYGWDSNTMALGNGKYAYQPPMYMTLGGFWVGAHFFVGYGGGFWTQHAVDSNYADYSDVYTNAYAYGTVHPADGYWRNYGVTIRCVTRR